MFSTWTVPKASTASEMCRGMAYDMIPPPASSQGEASVQKQHMVQNSALSALMQVCICVYIREVWEVSVIPLSTPPLLKVTQDRCPPTLSSYLHRPPFPCLTFNPLRSARVSTPPWSPTWTSA